MPEDKNGNGKKMLGIHTTEDFHRKVKMRCIERGLTLHEAVVFSLAVYLDVDVPEEYKIPEPKSVGG